ncbi:MAG: hypothetical protein ACYTGL_08320 [Planctomycetota bacterium]|jgi:hypothetical protein
MPLPRFSPLTLLRPLTVLVAVLGVQVLASQQADASCGDWLAGHEPVAVSSVGGGSDTGTIARRADLLTPPMLRMSDLFAADAPASMPCRGPGCRQLPSLPDAPLAPLSVRVVLPDWLLAGQAMSLCGMPIPGRLTPELDAVLPFTEQERIERPPRSC